MTGKMQKAKNTLKDFENRVQITQEEKTKLLDEAILEIHTENSDFIEGVAKLPIKSFRGMYILHTFYSMVDKLAEEKAQKLLLEKVKTYQKEEELKKRRK